MLVITKRCVSVVPKGTVPKSCRTTGGASLATKNLLAHGTGALSCDCAVSGNAQRANSIQVGAFHLFRLHTQTHRQRMSFRQAGRTISRTSDLRKVDLPCAKNYNLLILLNHPILSISPNIATRAISYPCRFILSRQCGPTVDRTAGPRTIEDELAWAMFVQSPEKTVADFATETICLSLNLRVTVPLSSSISGNLS